MKMPYLKYISQYLSICKFFRSSILLVLRQSGNFGDQQARFVNFDLDTSETMSASFNISRITEYSTISQLNCRNYSSQVILPECYMTSLLNEIEQLFAGGKLNNKLQPRRTILCDLMLKLYILLEAA